MNNIVKTDDGPDAATGCGPLFIYYHFSQLGFITNTIVAAGIDTLTGVYRNLTNDNRDPFPVSKQVVDAAFPGTAQFAAENLDNPYPLPTPRVLSAKRYADAPPL